MQRIFLFGLLFFFSLVSFAHFPDLTFQVESFKVERQPLKIEREFIADLQVEKFSQTKFLTSGRVIAIHAKANTLVKKDFVIAELENANVKKSLELALKNAALLQKETDRLEKLFKTKDITKTQLESKKRELFSAQMSEQQLKEKLQQTQVLAPFDGRVGVPQIKIGQQVGPETVVANISQGKFIIKAKVPIKNLREIKVGQPLRFNNLSSTISQVEAVIDPKTRTGFFMAHLDNCPSCIINDSGFTAVTIAEKPNAILVPKTAVFYDAGAAFVVKINKEGDQAKGNRVKVKTGFEKGSFVEVLEGLSASDEIVKANPNRIFEGAKVKVSQ